MVVVIKMQKKQKVCKRKKNNEDLNLKNAKPA